MSRISLSNIARVPAHSLLANLAAVLGTQLATLLAEWGARFFGVSNWTMAVLPIRTLIAGLASGALAFFVVRLQGHWLLAGLCIGICVDLSHDPFMGILELLQGYGGRAQIDTGPAYLWPRMIGYGFVLTVSLVGALVARVAHASSPSRMAS